jgi:hypothetical protein
MPDKQDPTPDPATDPTPPSQEEVEKDFFDKMEARLDTWFDKKVDKYRTTGTARMGKTTLPEIVANMFFGKQEGK